MVFGMNLGIQLYSVREDMERDFEGTLKKVKEMGFDGVEFAGLFNRDPADIKTMLDAIGLTGISAHVPLDVLLADPKKVVGDYQTVGCRYIAVPWLEESRRPGHEGYEQTLADIHRVGEACKEQGITLLYHNHDFEFAKEGDDYALDLMYEAIPADLLQTELDTCWVNVAGEDPVMYIRKYAGRAPVVHLKDFVMPGRKPTQLYELIGVATDEPQEESDVFDFRPNGYGVQNFPAILEAAADAGTQWVIVEQDRPSMGKSPMECTQMSIDYLMTL